MPFPIVAVGASAGGIEAFKQLLQALPVDTGMAFVMILHLPPTHSSMLSDILSRATTMPVRDAADGVALEPNHIYVIPPDAELAVSRGAFHLTGGAPPQGRVRPIDRFMRSLADAHGYKSIGVVLSGTANDGTQGLEEIKAAGGVTFAQDESAQQADMPRNAIASGSVDYVLAPHEIARELARIARHPHVAPTEIDLSAPPQPALDRVLEILRHSTGVDFANYKRNTLHRRITRRMLLHNLAGLAEYVALLQSDSREVEALYQDVLINVTSFFRDPGAYDALKAAVFTKLTADRHRQDAVRIWVLGCSSGEEAYSLAIAYAEFAENLTVRVPLQVFATDVNGVAIDKARSAVYPKAIAQDVSPDRLRRFFVEIDGGYRVSKEIREMCVFARQNALSDPPFSRIDLISCRNMLIYFDAVLQQRVIPVLHYALKSDGFLWLGGAETIGAYRDLFDLVDPRYKIYKRKGAMRGTVSLPSHVGRWSRAAGPAQRPSPGPVDMGADAHREADRVVLSRYAPPGVLVTDDFDIVQFRGDTSAYLAPAPGRATLNLLKMLREGLLVAVRGALHQARREKSAVRTEGLRARADGRWREVDVVVIPLRREVPAEGAYLVLFEETAGRMEARARGLQAEAQAAADLVPASRDESSAQEITRLSQELSATREYLQSVIEQQEAANEELQSANEEIQSANEELQSINEELETSKEEIQSSNEELATVNDELQNRNTELTRSYDDLSNLLASVNMAIVMLGPDLRIRRFTQPAEKILNIIDADLGRPFGDIKLGIDVPDLDSTIVEVIETATTREREVQDRHQRWYSLRVRPYRTLDNKIDGAVLVLVDVDNIKRAEQSMRESEKRFEVLADTAPVLMWLNDLEGCRFVNRAFEEFVGEPEARIRKKGHEAFVHPEDRAAFVDAYSEALRRRERFERRLRLRRADGAYRWMKVLGVPRLAGEEMIGFVGCTFDITDMAEAEAALRELDRGKNEFLAILAHELRNPLSGVRNASRLLDSKDDAEIERARAIIERQTQHMVRMIDDLLDISRITYGKIQLRSEPLDILAVLRRSIDATQGQRAQMQQQLEENFPATPLHVNGDAVRLEQVFSNLLANASRFTRRGGRIWIVAEREPAGGGAASAVIRVRDNGAGIAASVLPHIFDLFVQGDSLSEHNRTGIGIGIGIGLGLTLAKRLVELHHATIEAYSAGDALGSEFVVRMPLLDAQPGASAGAADRSSAREPERKRILIVDDNVDSADSLSMLLARSGHEIRTVEEGAQALPVAAEFKPDLIVLDIGLPDLDGYSVARQLRADPRTRDTLLVAMTGYGRDEDRAQGMAAGIDDQMTKPVDIDALLERLAAGRSGPAR